jgi:hypothetical protein
LSAQNRRATSPSMCIGWGTTRETAGATCSKLGR